MPGKYPVETPCDADTSVWHPHVRLDVSPPIMRALPAAESPVSSRRHLSEAITRPASAKMPQMCKGRHSMCVQLYDRSSWSHQLTKGQGITTLRAKTRRSCFSSENSMGLSYLEKQMGGSLEDDWLDYDSFNWSQTSTMAQADLDLENTSQNIDPDLKMSNDFMTGMDAHLDEGQWWDDTTPIQTPSSNVEVSDDRASPNFLQELTSQAMAVGTKTISATTALLHPSSAPERCWKIHCTGVCLLSVRRIYTICWLR